MNSSTDQCLSAGIEHRLVATSSAAACSRTVDAVVGLSRPLPSCDAVLRRWSGAEELSRVPYFAKATANCGH